MTKVLEGPAEKDAEPAPSRSTEPHLERLGSPLGWLRVAVSIPDRVLVWVLCAAVATAVTVQLEIFKPYTVLPLFLILVVASWRLRPSALPDPRRQAVGVAIGLVLVVAWCALQWPNFGEYVSLSRDPGVYTTRAVWLVHHSSPDYTVPAYFRALARAVPDARATFLLQMQSTTVVPGLLAIVGWAGGNSLLMHANMLIGCAALIGFYAVGRRFIGPFFGLVPVIALLGSMTFAAITRIPFTEPLSMTGTMICLLGLICGARERRASMWLLGGFGAGLVVVSRIDGTLVPVAAIVGIGIWGAFAQARSSRQDVLQALAWFVIGTTAVGFLGLTDLVNHSPAYFGTLRRLAVPMIIAIPATTLVAATVTVLPIFGGLSRFISSRSRRMSLVAAAIVAVAVVLMLLRPLYYTANQLSGASNAAYRAVVAARQQAEGMPVDGSRSYDEHSLTWMTWYFGGLTVLLACAAGVAAVAVAVRRRSVELVLLLALVGINAALYLNRIIITPDQIWAMRRFAPVIVPGGLLFAGWGLQQLSRLGTSPRVVARLCGASGDRRGVAHWTFRGAAVVLSVVMAVYPLFTWGGLFRVREWAGQYDFVQQICSQIRDQPVIIAGRNPQGGLYQPTFRSFCGSDVLTLSKPDVATIAKIVRNVGGRQVKVVAFFQDAVPWAADPGRPMFAADSVLWESTLTRRPSGVIPKGNEVWIGIARADGKVAPL